MPLPYSSFCHTSSVHTALHITSHHIDPDDPIGSNRLCPICAAAPQLLLPRGHRAQVPLRPHLQGRPHPLRARGKQQLGPVEPRVHFATVRAPCVWLVGALFGLGSCKRGPVFCRCKVSHLGQPLPFPHALFSYHPAALCPPIDSLLQYDDTCSASDNSCLDWNDFCLGGWRYTCPEGYR